MLDVCVSVMHKRNGGVDHAEVPQTVSYHNTIESCVISTGVSSRGLILPYHGSSQAVICHGSRVCGDCSIINGMQENGGGRETNAIMIECL